jgi:tetratricopeptide (TPR) repeat protein
MMLLGKISLEKEWDAKDAEKYYYQALTWFKQAREKRDAMSLYAPMSNDLKTQTKATQKPTSLNKWKRTVYHKEDPLRLYNTASAPSWYISGKEKNCIFALGFLTFSNGKYDEAKRYWEQLPALDDTVGTANSNYPSLMIRLMSACRFKLLIFSEAELVDVKNINERLRINYASLLFMLERFADSEAMFDKIFKTSKNLYVKALCMINKGNIADCKADGKKVAFKCYKWVLEKKKLKKSIIYGTALINYANALCGTSKGYILSVPFYEEYIKRFKKIGRYDYYRKASYRIVSCLIKQKKYSKAKQLFSKFKKEKNDVYVKVLEYKFKRANQGVNL